ncbi:MAG: fibronectin type III domain-containing protein, partial [Patescibacteria group bacterium]
GGSQGNALGIGWISLSSQTAGAGGGAPYSVFMEKSGGDVRKLSGYAWSGIKCNPNENRGPEATCGYGWLSFEEKDLGGCPSGECAAKVYMGGSEKGKVSGWAKFLTANPANGGAWTGWVSLRNEEKGYGVCFGDTNPEGEFGKECAGNGNVAADKAFSGWAWGDAVGGWVQFIGSGGLGGPGTTSPDCQVTGVTIQEPNRSANLGQKLPFAAIPSYNRAGCASELDWSIVENVMDSSYGSIVFLAPARPNGAEYTAPGSLPTGVTFPFIATVKVRVRGTELFDTRIVQVRDILPQVVAQCTNPQERSISVSWSGVSPVGNTTKIFRDESPTGSFNTLLHSVSGMQERGLCADGGGASGLCSGRQGVELNTPYYYKVEVTYADGTVKEGVAPSRAECRLATVAPTNVQVFAESDKVLWVNWKDNDTRKGRTFTVERVRVTPAKPEYPAATSFKRAEAVSDSEIKLQWDNTTNWTPYGHAIARVKEPNAITLESFAKEDATRDVFKKTADVVVLEKNEGAPSFLPTPFQATSKRFTFLDGALIEGTTYYYRVGSCSEVSLRDIKGMLQYRTKFLAGLVGKPEIPCGAFSEPVSATTELKAPELFSVEAISSSEIRLAWKDNSGKEDGYEVYRDSAATPTHILNTPNAEAWEDSGLSSDTSYSYRVRAYKNLPAGKKVYSD